MMLRKKLFSKSQGIVASFYRPQWGGSGNNLTFYSKLSIIKKVI
jgi:hypothetical protein